MKRGFSLAELSIVLIIIGLLVAGVSAGSKMIRSAELNKLVGEITEINTAYTTFVQTYDALPGDFDNAESFWGNTGLSNGDGDGKIEINAGAAATANDEVSNVFHHLALSEILSGSYSTTISDGTYGYVSSSGAKAVISNGTNSTPATLDGFATTDLNTQNLLIFGSTLSNGARTAAVKDPGAHSPFLTPRDAHRIDQKLDDGLPKAGTVTYRTEGHTSSLGTTATGASGCENSSAYVLTATTKLCNLVYELSDL